MILLQDKKAAMKLALIEHEIEGMNITVTHPVLEQERWTFINSMFFCCSLYTSIGESDGFKYAVTVIYAHRLRRPPVSADGGGQDRDHAVLVHRHSIHVGHDERSGIGHI